MEIDFNEVKTYVVFEFIEILDDKDPYPTLPGIYWALDIYVILNLK
jgi:hypothetical protein